MAGRCNRKRGSGDIDFLAVPDPRSRFALTVSTTVQQVEKCQQRMPPNYPRARESHHPLDLLPHGRLIAMDLAVGAGRLVGVKRAADQTA